MGSTWLGTCLETFTTQTHIDGTRSSGKYHAIVVVGKMLRMEAPALNGFFKAADYRKTQRSQTRWQPVNQGPGGPRCALQASTGGL